MCGITGYFNHKNAKSLVETSLKKIRNRGINGSGIVGEPNNALGHVLHAVVNSVPQPFDGKSKFAINGEIYNWKELNNKYELNARNDSEVVYKLLDLKGIEILDELDGVYAFCFWKNDKVILARDIIGVKPLWYSLSDGLCFSSEKKALDAFPIDELNPRFILEYDLKSNKCIMTQRKFYDILPEHTELHGGMVDKVINLLQEAVKKRIPDQKFGILFSGGIDSAFIAYICKKMNLDFICYTSALKSETPAHDLLAAKRVAKEMGLNLKYKEITIDEVPKYLKKIVPLIEDSNVTKVGVGLTFYIACELAKKDKIKVIFSGLGSEEIFAGYERHKLAANVNQECISGLRKMYERDLYRDDVITMNNNIELRLPFLDKKLVSYSLKIPAKYKLKKQTKIILRDAAKKIGIDQDTVDRPKKAAQYGSRFNKALIKLTKKSEFELKSDYLKTFYPYENLKLAALVSGGKDSFYAMHLMQKQNYEISCFVTLKSDNQDSYMYHTPNVDLVKKQAKFCRIPLIMQKTKGVKEEELVDMELALIKAKKYGIQGVVTGAIFSNYQRERVEKVCDKLGLKVFSPLWHMNQEHEMRCIVDAGFEFIISSIAADGLDKSWLNC